MEKPTVEWTDKASEQAKDILDYLYDSSPTYAGNWADQLQKKLMHLTQFPEMGRIVPEFGVSFIREVFVGQYRLVYTIQHNRISIVTIRSMQLPLGRI